MALNRFNSEHKATNEKYREGYDRIFGKKDKKSSTDDKKQEKENDIKYEHEK